jgi:uncharacterized membrane protein YfcA
VLLAAAMEAALLAGALVRALMERVQGRPDSARAAARAAGGIALVGLAFMVTIVIVARVPRGVFALLSLAAVGVVLARAWRARLRAGAAEAPRRPRSAPRTSAAVHRPSSPLDRRRARIRRTAARPAPRRRVSS